ncbi:MAG: hypothetical protein ACO2ZL_08560 [Flavobacteriales bacterium]
MIRNHPSPLVTRVLVVLVLLIGFSQMMEVDAQCVMCKAVAEDSADDGGLGAGLNRGILYLMAIPYILLSALFFVIYRKRKTAS